MHNKYKLYVISHTHWDREWYQTFQGFRRRLVYMVDNLIEHMEKNTDYKYFHMDGQTIMLEDYLQIRPENEERLKKLISDGRIIIGPWYVMPDEFLVSGESLVRNIQKGFEISKCYGVEPMKNGYVVDIFGHNSQFPQILKGFGIDSAVLYRGIGDYSRDAFTWEAPDGSSVLCLKLDRDRSYSNFYFTVRWPFDERPYNQQELVSRVTELLELSRGMAVSNNLLMMDGVDHIEINEELTKIINILKENIDGIEIIHSTLEEYVRVQLNSEAALEVIKGELYQVGLKGINNQVLKNVLSSMVHIKQMNNQAETLLTRWAEPLNASMNLISPLRMESFLEEAWKYTIQNHPHDSICGCSISRVHMDNEYRFNQAIDLAGEVIRHTMDVMVSMINTNRTGKPNALVIFNAGQRDFTGVVEATIELPADSQSNFKIYDSDGAEISYQILNVKKNTTKGVFKYGRIPEFPLIDAYRVAFSTSIPAVGYKTYGYEEFRTVYPQHGDYTYREFHAPVRYEGSMQTGHQTWENEYLKVGINHNGTLNVVNKETGKEYKELLIFEDCADVGDGWNYRKPLNDARYLSICSNCDVAVENDGPMAVCWRVTQKMNLPVGMNETRNTRSEVTAEFTITTYIKMKKGSSQLEFKTLLDNNVLEHRLRVLFPTYLDTETFYSSTPFYLQERDIKRPDRCSYVEPETGVFPNQGIVFLKDKADCIALYNKGLYEIEITQDAGRVLALTLFRSFRSEVGRDEGELSYMKRNMIFEYALEFGTAATQSGDVMVKGEAWRTGMLSICTGSHTGELGIEASFLKVDIPGAVLSAYKTAKHQMTVVRLYNCTEEETKGTVTLFAKPQKAYLLDLNDNIQEERDVSENVLNVQLKGAKIVTFGFVF